MNDPGAPPRRRRWWKWLLLAASSGLILLALFAWYATTDSFQSMVRRHLVAELERVTGGRVELGGFHTIPFRLQVDVRDLTIHGSEGSNEIPLAHVDRLLARIKITSIARTEVSLHSLVLDHPVIHVLTYADGSTNLPQPGRDAAAGIDPVEQLFRLRIGHLALKQGEVLWNDQKIPLDLTAADVGANANYSLLHRRYDADLLIGAIDTKYSDYRPVSWRAETHFSLERSAVELRSVKISSGNSFAEASGRITNFKQPEFVGQYGLKLNLADAAVLLRYPQLRRGILQIDARGSCSSNAFSSSGNVQLSDVEWRDKTLAFRSANFKSQFNVDPQRLALSAMQATLMGGEARGDMEIAHWLNPSLPGKREKVAPEQKGTVNLKIKDLSLREVATALSALGPLREMNLAGSASGTVVTRWKGSPRDAESEIALQIAPPTQPSPGQLPLRAQVRATYRQAPGEVEVSELTAATRATQLRASGTLSRRAALKISVASADLAEWNWLLQTVGSQPATPVISRGAASFNGTAVGQLSDVTLTGKLQAENLEILLPAAAHTPRTQVRWDLLSAEVQLSPHALAVHEGTIHHGSAAVNFSANAVLRDWQFTSDGPFTAHARTHNAEASDALALFGLQYPVTGKVDFSLQAGGSRSQPDGAGSIQLGNASILGKPIRHLESNFSFQGTQISLHDLQVVYLDADVNGSGTYNLSTHAFNVDLHGHNFDLAAIPELQLSPLPVEGRVDFEAHSQGTPDAPTINATLHLRSLLIGHQHVGNYTFDAVTQGAELQLHGRSDFKEAVLNIDGDVHLREDWPGHLDLHFKSLNVNPLLRIYLGKHVTGSSEAGGEVQLQGPLLSPKAIQVTGNISDFLAEIDHVPIHNDGLVRFGFSNGSLALQQLRLAGEGTDLAVEGTANLQGEQRLALHAEGHANLKLFQELNPDFTSSGSVAVNVSVAGTISRPSFQGRLQVADGYIQYSDLPSALSEIKASLVFNQDRLQIETLTARVGGGLVTFGGYATAYHRQLNFDLTLSGQDVRLRYPQGVSSMSTAQLRWTGTSSASRITGDVTITKLAVTPGFDFGSYFASSVQTVALPPTNPLLGAIALDVHIVSTPELQMQSAAIRLSGDADFHLRGSAAKPVLLGRADIIEGDIYFNGAKYRLERGDITFTNPVTTTPFLDLQASTRVRDYDITLTVTGQVDKLKLSYRSEPPLPQADIISLLAVGQTQEQSAQLQQAGQSPYVTQASSAVLAEAINSALSNRSQRLFGISHIKIDPQGLNTETTPVQPNPLPAVTIEQQVRENITLTYTTNVAQSSQQIIQGEYNISRDLIIVGIRDYNGVVSFEIRRRQRKR